jgi:PAS domain S-box-containing protein
MRLLPKNIDATYLISLFEHTTEGIILTNKEGIILLANPAAQIIFGYTENEPIGNPIELLIPGLFSKHHADLRWGFYTHPQHRVMEHGLDLYGRGKDGIEFPVEVSLSFYERNEELFVTAFIADISHRKMIEQDNLSQQIELERVTNKMKTLNAELETKVEERTMILQEALKELEKSQKDLSEALGKEKELNEIKSRFVTMASHEFRTPLSTVLSSAALVSKYVKTEDQDKRDRHIKRIKDSVKHLNDLLEDFLSLGKLEEGKVRAKTDKIDITDFLDEVLEEIKTITKPGQQIQIEMKGDPWIITDKKLLKNILINLLSNAVKFSPEESCICLNVHNANNMLEIAVKDQGIGISAEDQQLLFSSFFRGRNAVNIPGTGLGLHIVKRYVNLLQGNIRVESGLQAGTNVIIELPELHLE